MSTGSSSNPPRNSLLLPSVLVILVGIISALTYQSILKPPPPKLYGSPGGPEITAPRIKLRDGRYLAYKEHGVSREKARRKVIFIHGSDCCRHDAIYATRLSPGLIEELGMYLVSFDRPGYGESDPDPNRTPKSLALDVEELADQLNLGAKFYVIGYSMGGQATWGCLKYIPHRLAGATLVSPVVNYWWKNLPLNVSTQGYSLQPKRDQWAVRVAHYAPWLIYWWNAQKWFPGSSVANRDGASFSQPDKDIILKLGSSRKPHLSEVRPQGLHETINRDMIVGFGSWEFDPIELENPFSNDHQGGSVHLWQGDDDMLVPVMPQRYIAVKLPWLHYHEVPRSGHFFHYNEGVVDDIVKTLFKTDAERTTMGANETNVESKEYRLSREVKEALQAIASEWEDVIDSKALQVIPLKGAMTNEVFQIKWPTRESGPSRKVLVRIYGEGVGIFFDREDEIRTFEFMSKHGHGPLLLARFGNGRIEEFLHARTLSASDMRDPDISGRIATRMKEFHGLDMPGVKKALLWDRLRNWLSACKRLASPEEAKSFRLDVMEKEITLLEKALFKNNEKIGFCHNDLQYGNIMMDEETKAITIIDYEYSCYNPVAYDIANHFCEMAADYHSETPHIMDYTKYPGVEERKRFVKTYMSPSGEEKPSDTMINKLLEDVEKYTLASHLTWGLWGIISEHVNEIDFNYMEYARQRFQQYWLTKPKLIGNP